MRKIFPITIVLILSLSAKLEAQYKDFIVLDTSIVGLTENGNLVIFDKEKGQKIKNIAVPSKAVLLTKDKKNKMVIVDEKNNIYRYVEEKREWEKIGKSKKHLYGILFDSNNTGYIIKHDGIVNTKTKRKYFSDQSLNTQIRYVKAWHRPYTYFMDEKDRIWLGFGYGEWGGNIIIFDTKNKKFLKPELNDFKPEFWPVQSFFETPNDVYLSSGLYHLRIQGIIVKFDNELKARKIYVSKTDWKKNIQGEYIGPATYNKFDNSIYYYSQEGIKKGNLNDDLSKKENWKVVVKPKLHWNYGQPNAAGAPMNVLKLEILDENKLIFLSQKDGIGIFNGKELIMINDKNE